ncbi:MAG: pilus assembly protein [Thiobacillus sp.]
MTAFKLKPVSLALVAAFSTGFCGMTSASLLSLSQVPLFVTSGAKANVLLIFSNSNAMDEDPTGLAVGSADPASKSEIARTAARSLVTNYTGQINMGLMAYQQYPYSSNVNSGDTNVVPQWLSQAPYDASYDPANYPTDASGNPTYTGPRNGTSKRFRIANPTSPGDYVYYNVNLPSYSTGPGSLFCYSSTASFDNGSENPSSGPWDTYRCFASKTGTSDVIPVSPYSTNDPAAGYSSYQWSNQFFPTDSDLAQNITDFGKRLATFDVGPTWFSNKSPGLGYLHVPIANLDSTQAAKLNLKLATEVVPTYSGGSYNTNPTGISSPGNTPTNPDAPLINAGLTPITGTFKTAKDYFNGATSYFGTDQGGPQATPPNSCGKDFVVFLTNGLPSVKVDGSSVTYQTGQPYSASEVANAVDAVTDLNSGTRPVKTYVIGFALPEFTNNYFVTNPPNPLDRMAVAGGTTSASYANNLTALNSTFNTIFSSIIAQSGAAAAVAMTSGSVTAGGKIYQGQFNSSDWSGDMIAYNTDATTGAITTVAWQAGTVINSQNYDTGRKIITYKPSTASGIPFRWPANPASPTSTELDTSQTTALTSNPGLDGTNPSDTGANRLNYLRGQTGINGFRPRLISVLGDIVNSAPSYVGAPAFNYPDNLEAASYYAFRSAYSSRAPMIYVGANDGMLHGFDATTGQEKLAYVPSKVYPNLAQLTSPNYNHRYYADGSPTVVDTFYSGAWHTTLVASLGGGGQGLYALDVTNPSTFSEANAGSIVKWEYNDADLGYVYGQPSIVKLNTGQWAAVFSNGYNNSEADGTASTTGYAYLYIVDIGTGQLIKKISTKAGSVATPNALATPTLVDANGDGTVDYAYAGDLQGNMWKFDLCNANNQGVCASNTNGWAVAFGTSTTPLPLFTARDASNNPQPITSSAEVTRFYSGDGYQLFFGTGKYLENGDIATTGTQTFYSVWDKGLSPSTISGRSVLQEQTITTTTTVSGNEYRTTSSNAVAWDGLVPGGTMRGWYMDLPASGERVVSDPALYDNRVLFTTLIPNATACSGGGDGWLMELDSVTGAALGGATFDVDGNGVVNTDDNLGTPGVYASGVKKSSIPSAVRMQKNPGGPGGGSMNKWTSMSKKNTTTNTSLENELNSLPPIQNRSSWRQIFQ